MEFRFVPIVATATLLAMVLPQTLVAQSSIESPPIARLIIQLRQTGPADINGLRQTQALSQSTGQGAGRSIADRARQLAERSGLPLRSTRDLGNGMVALALAGSAAGSTLEDTLDALRADPDIEFAEIDQRRYARALPSDPLYPGQWYLQGVELSATNFEAAWDTTKGSSDTVIAVLDTGIRFEHPDLAGRVLPGYDFVSGESSTSFAAANDGNGWDPDASDPGDWLSAGDLQTGPLADCPQTDPSRSSWHGTRVAAMVGATTDNATGMAGGTWSGFILPVRVLGKCGGFDSDIIAGMRWAAGLPVTGVPTNPNRATILNLSLGGVDTCRTSYKNVISELTSAGVLVVASAGNDSGPVDTPANCPGVLAVGGLRHAGTKVGYSSLGPEVGISAPAGNCPDEATTFLCGYSLITADNTGLTVPATSSYTDEANYNIGTSFSAPIVSAVAGLMHSLNDGLTTTEVISRLKASARAFPLPQAGLPTCPATSTDIDSPGQCNCTTTTCGAGIADAPGAVAEALRPMARVVKPGGSTAGKNVTLDGTSSGAARGRTLSSYSWTISSGNASFVGGTTASSATVAVPTTGRITVRLEVADEVGRTDWQEVTLGVASGSSSGGGGGGGATHPVVLLALTLLLARRRRAVADRR